MSSKIRKILRQVWQRSLLYIATVLDPRGKSSFLTVLKWSDFYKNLCQNKLEKTFKKYQEENFSLLQEVQSEKEDCTPLPKKQRTFNDDIMQLLTEEARKQKQLILQKNELEIYLAQE